MTYVCGCVGVYTVCVCVCVCVYVACILYTVYVRVCGSVYVCVFVRGHTHMTRSVAQSDMLACVNPNAALWVADAVSQQSDWLTLCEAANQLINSGPHLV